MYTSIKQKPLFYALLTSITFAAGMLLCAYMNEWIIIKFPSYKTDITTYKETTAQVTHKEITLFFWHHDAWQHEKISTIWSEDTAHNVYYLTNSWLNVLDEEEVTDKKTSLQTAMLNPSGQELFLSFDRNPFAPASSTFEKWMWIEGLLKTLRENGTTVQCVRFLVHHQPLDDDHLDFSSAWPLQGFIQNAN